MERRYPLAGGQGWLTLQEEGLRVRCRGELRDDRRGLYKCYLLGKGERFLLGTFLPEQGRLQLRRSLSLDELRRRGMWPPEGAEAELAFVPGSTARPRAPAGWSWEANPARLMGEPLLARAAGNAGAFLRREEGGFLLAFPGPEGMAFPMTPRCCFARVAELDGRRCAVFPFSSCGCPRVPQG